jgi:hypothetical protein
MFYFIFFPISFKFTINVLLLCPHSSVVFMKENVTVTPLMTYSALRDALTNGRRVHSVSDYGRCSINVTATGGGAIVGT